MIYYSKFSFRPNQLSDSHLELLPPVLSEVAEVSLVSDDFGSVADMLSNAIQYIDGVVDHTDEESKLIKLFVKNPIYAGTQIPFYDDETADEHHIELFELNEVKFAAGEIGFMVLYHTGDLERNDTGVLIEGLPRHECVALQQLFVTGGTAENAPTYH